MKNFVFFTIYVIIIFSLQCFNYSDWLKLTGGYHYAYYIFYFIVLYLAIKGKSIHNNKLVFKNSVLLLYGVSFLCVINILNKGESVVGESLYFILPMALLLYFVLLDYNVSVESLINSLIVLGLVVFFIQVFQNIFPSSAVFGILDTETTNPYDVGEVAHQRNGLYRYILLSTQISIFCFCYSWSRIIENRNMKNIIMFLIFASSIYLYLTRQIIFALIVTIVLTTLFSKGKKGQRNTAKWITIGFLVVLCAFSTVLFSDFLEMTKDGGESTEYRMLSYPFYWKESTKDILSFICGNGHPRALADWKDMGLHPSDVGFVGELFHKGIFFIIFYVSLVYRILVKYRKTTPAYIRLYVLATFLNSVIGFPMRSGATFVQWAIIIYIAELGYQQKREIIINTKHNGYNSNTQRSDSVYTSCN